MTSASACGGWCRESDYARAKHRQCAGLRSRPFGDHVWVARRRITGPVVVRIGQDNRGVPGASGEHGMTRPTGILAGYKGSFREIIEVDGVGVSARRVGKVIEDIEVRDAREINPGHIRIYKRGDSSQRVSG